MIVKSLSFVAAATGGQRAGDDIICHGVTTDTRMAILGKLFIPLQGDRFDGHDYVQQAVEQGASCFLWGSKQPVPERLRLVPHIRVTDTLRALQDLASAYRQSLTVRVIGVTGSNGKTSAKDMIAAILADSFITYKTQGNLNNHIGLPLSILNWNEDVQVAVLEMGMSAPNEIALLARIARPEIGVITNIGEAHIGLLGSRENIACAKWELISALPPHGLAVLPADERLLRRLPVPSGVQTMWAGEDRDADIRFSNYTLTDAFGCQFRLDHCKDALEEESLVFELPVPGRHQVRNALCAIAVAAHFGIDHKLMQQRLAQAQLTPMRMQILQPKDDLIILLDAYNAAPASLQAALLVLRDLPVNRRIAVLGDMLELGEQSAMMHEQMGRVTAYIADSLIAVGMFGRDYIAGIKAAGWDDAHVLLAVETVDQARNELKNILDHTDGVKTAVLIKGSRKIQLERILESLY